jgi:hypothetical protein
MIGYGNFVNINCPPVGTSLCSPVTSLFHESPMRRRNGRNIPGNSIILGNGCPFTLLHTQCATTGILEDAL